MVEREFGIPWTTIDMDTLDKSFTTKERVLDQLEGFFETTKTASSPRRGGKQDEHPIQALEEMKWLTSPFPESKAVKDWRACGKRVMGYLGPGVPERSSTRPGCCPCVSAATMSRSRRTGPRATF